MNNPNCYNSISIVAISIGELHQLSMEIFLSIITLIFISSFWVCGAVDCGGSQISSTITVDKSNKSSDFTSLQAAIDSISPNNTKWVKIQINAGTYKYVIQHKITISSSSIFFSFVIILN